MKTRVWVEIVMLASAAACAIALLFATLGAAAGAAVGAGGPGQASRAQPSSAADMSARDEPRQSHFWLPGLPWAR